MRVWGCTLTPSSRPITALHKFEYESIISDKMRAGTILAPPTGSTNQTNSLVLNDGQQLVHETNEWEKMATPVLPSSTEPAEEKTSKLKTAVSVVSTFFLLTTTGLAVTDAFFLRFAMECLEEPNGSRALYEGLALAAIACSLAGTYYKIKNYVEDRVHNRVGMSEMEVKAFEEQRKITHRKRLHFGQLLEDGSMFLAVLPSILSLVLRKPDIISKILAVSAVVSALLPFGTSYKQEYMCRKLVSMAVLATALVLLVLTFFSLGNDKSLVIYHVTDSNTNQTYRLARQEDQVSYDGVRYCESSDNFQCILCFTAAVYGRGNNTWSPKANDTGQCAGITITFQEAFDCTELGKQVPLTGMTIFEEDTCALNSTLRCHPIDNPGRYTTAE